MNFDRYNNSSQHNHLIDDPIQSIQLEHEKLQILRRQFNRGKTIIFFDNNLPDHKTLLSFYKSDHCKKWSSFDPYLHFDLHYNAVKNCLSNDELTILHNYIIDYFSSKLKSSKSSDEKESG